MTSLNLAARALVWLRNLQKSCKFHCTSITGTGGDDDGITDSTVTTTVVLPLPLLLPLLRQSSRVQMCTRSMCGGTGGGGGSSRQ